MTRPEPPTASDVRTFDDLFAEERTPMTRLAYLVTGSEPIAEEVVQDAFAQVYERWERLDRPGAYLRSCVVNGARRAGARHRRELRLVTAPPMSAGLEARELMDALGRLRPAWRAVVVLRFHADMTQDEIAETLDIAGGTVKALLWKARRRLEQYLEEGR